METLAAIPFIAKTIHSNIVQWCAPPDNSASIIAMLLNKGGKIHSYWKEIVSLAWDINLI